MDDRKFLDKIRKLQESGKKIGLTESTVGDKYSEKPSMKKLLREYEENSDIQTVEPDEQRDEENKFKDTVSKLVKFSPIKVHKENVEWSGNLVREKIQWNYSLDEKIGCYIQSMTDGGTSSPIQLTDDTLEVIKKLRGYYDVWSDEWSARLTGGSAEETTEETPTETTPTETGGEEETGGFGF
jgi:hypothetical protein